MIIYRETIGPMQDARLPAPFAPVAAAAPSEADALEAALRDMTESFSGDFIDGRVGQLHNTFEHRSRVLRQLTAKLAAMRSQEATLTQ